MWRRVLSAGFLVLAAPLWGAMPEAHAAVPWTWPVVGPIIHGFDPPSDPYGSGHRGIDIGTDLSTVVVASDDGVVTFAGKVGGMLFLTIGHGGGVTSTCSWLNAVMVRKGDHVARGQPVALTDWGHPDEFVPHLHFGVRLNGTYVDPLDYLGWPSVSDLIRLAPIDPSAPAPRVAAGRMTNLAYHTMARAAGAGGSGVGGDPGQRGLGDRRRLVAAVPGRRPAHRPRAGGHPRPPLRRFVVRHRRRR